MKINVAVIDDREEMLRQIRHILDEDNEEYIFHGGQPLQPDIHTIEFDKYKGGKVDEDAILNMLYRINPGVAIVDMRLEGDDPGDFSGVDLSLKIKSYFPNCSMILISSFFNVEDNKIYSDLSIFSDLLRREIPIDEFKLKLKEKLKKALFTYISSINYRGKRFAKKINNNRETMWGLVIGPNQTGIRIEHQLPLPYLKSNSIMVELLEVGICGTDKRSLGQAPSPAYDIIEFHEAFGKVVWTGEGVRTIKVGDYVVPMVRRCEYWDNPRKGSPITASSFNFSRCEYSIQSDCYHKADQCLMGEYRGTVQDMKQGYKSRGTGKCHGFGSQYFIDTEDWLIRVNPPGSENKKFRNLMMRRYIFTEPLSIVWKTHREIAKYYNIKEFGNNMLVIGVGPIGLMALTLFKYLHPGLQCTAIDLASDTRKRACILKKHFRNIEYLQTRKEDEPPDELKDKKFHIIIEASGQPEKIFKYALSLLASGGILVLLGVSEDDSTVYIDSKAFTQFVKKGNILIGSINSSRADFEDSIAFMEKIIRNQHSILDDMADRWEIEPGLPNKIIQILAKTAPKDREEIKVILNAQGYTEKIRKGQ